MGVGRQANQAQNTSQNQKNSPQKSTKNYHQIQAKNSTLLTPIKTLIL